MLSFSFELKGSSLELVMSLLFAYNFIQLLFSFHNWFKGSEKQKNGCYSLSTSSKRWWFFDTFPPHSLQAFLFIFDVFSLFNLFDHLFNDNITWTSKLTPSHSPIFTPSLTQTFYVSSFAMVHKTEKPKQHKSSMARLPRNTYEPSPLAWSNYPNHLSHQ